MTNRIYIKNTQRNMTPVIREILDSIDDSAETVIQFEKDEYHFFKEGSQHQMSYSSCGRSAENDTVFPLYHKQNIVIDGGGSSFVFCDRVQPFTLKNDDNITLQNFSIDYSFLRYVYADIVSVSNEGMELSLDSALFRYSVVNEAIVFHCGVEDMSSEYRKISCKPICSTNGGIYFLYIGDYKGVYNPAAPNVLASAEKTDNGVFLRFLENSAVPDFSPGGRVCLAYDNDREMQAFHCEFSKNINVRNVTIHRQGGMGFVADACETITLDQFHIRLKPGRNEYFTTTADGVFLTNCRGQMILRNSVIEDTYDDAMNIHGFYMAIEKVLSDTRVQLTHVHSDHWGVIPYRSGDVVYFTDPATCNEVGNAVIKHISYDENRETIMVEFHAPVLLQADWLVENRTGMPEVLMEQNTVRNCPHIRLSSRLMTVRNNQFFLKHADIYIDDLVDFYKEYGAVESVMITDNYFGNSSVNNIQVVSQRPKTSNHLHETIVIERNTFEKERDAAFRISHVNNLIERNNIFGVREESNFVGKQNLQNH